jgi:CHAT domain-containing protein/uncharacterized protein HemY
VRGFGLLSISIVPGPRRRGAAPHALTRAFAVTIVALATSVGAAGPALQERSLPDTLAEGFRRLDARQLDEAAALFTDARQRAADAQDSRDEAVARRGLGRVLLERRQFERALAELSEALRLAEAAGDRGEVGRTLASRGLVFTNTGDWPRMEEAYESAIAALGEAGAFRDQAAAMRGLNYSPRMPWDQRERRIERAVEILAREPDTRTEGLLLHQWGDILFNQGRYALAVEKLRQALPRLRAANDRSSLARLLTSVGRTYRVHGLWDDAMAQYREALRIQTALGDLAGASQSENATATALERSGRHRAALRHAVRALALAERDGVPTQIAFLRMNLAMSYNRVGEPKRALPLLAPDPALNRFDESLRWWILSKAHLQLGQGQTALADAERAVAAARDAGDPERVANSLEIRAESHLALGDLETAYRDDAEALGIVEKMRTNLSPEDRFRQNFSDAMNEFFTSSIHVLTRLGRHAEALDVAEQARARAFLDLLASRDVTSASAQGARDAERRRLIAAGPIAHDAMRAALRGLHSTLLAYWVAPDGAHVWVIGPDGVVHGRGLTVTAYRLRSLIDAMTKAGQRQGDGAKADPARVLYDELVKPIASWLPARSGSLLTVVPHGPLFALPFAALRDAEGRYFVERYAVHFVTSLSVLGQTSVRSASPATGEALLVADPTLDRALMAREGLAPLKGARAEVTAIAKGLAPQAVSVLTGPAATEAAVKRDAPSARILHFATHAVVSDSGPLDSFLALAAGDGEDGRVTSAEVYEWKLDAELVVLSACRTSRGRISGDGVIGLSRAFAYAGAPSLLGTVWDAPDEIAGRLLPAFYAEWRRSGDRARALRAAQLGLIENLRAGQVVVQTKAGSVTLQERPALWAPFVLLGAP